MSWKNILKVYPSVNRARKRIADNLKRLNELKQMFENNKQKSIGYIPIQWGIGIEKEIKNTAAILGLEYKRFEQKRKIAEPNPKGHSFANGGHFMWDANEIEPYLEQTDFSTVQELIEFIANNSYRSKSYRRVIDGLFGTPNILLQADRKEGVGL
jgi:hypothetical protein